MLSSFGYWKKKHQMQHNIGKKPDGSIPTTKDGAGKGHQPRAHGAT